MLHAQATHSCLTCTLTHACFPHASAWCPLPHPSPTTAANVSSIRFEHRQLQGLGWQDFHVAAFAARGAPAASFEDDKPTVPPGLRPERACLFTRKDEDLQCSFTYANAPGNAYLLLTKQLYTDVRAAQMTVGCWSLRGLGRLGACAASARDGVLLGAGGCCWEPTTPRRGCCAQHADRRLCFLSRSRRSALAGSSPCPTLHRRARASSGRWLPTGRATRATRACAAWAPPPPSCTICA